MLFSLVELTRGSDTLKQEWEAGDQFAIFESSNKAQSKCYEVSGSTLTTLAPIDEEDQFIDMSSNKYIAFHPYYEGWSYDDYQSAVTSPNYGIDFLSSGDFSSSTTFTMNHTLAALHMSIEAGLGYEEGFKWIVAEFDIGSRNEVFEASMSSSDTEGVQKLEFTILVTPGDYSDSTRVFSIRSLTASGERSATVGEQFSTTDNLLEAGKKYGYDSYYISDPVEFGQGESEENPYYIYTLSDMKAVGQGDYISYSNQVENGNAAEAQDWGLDKYYKLMLDIDLEGTSSNRWTSITNFKGVFDGNEHTLSNLYISATSSSKGLFGYVGNPAVIKNITIDSGTISSVYYNIAAIVGSAEGTSSEQVTILNCHNLIDIEYYSYDYAISHNGCGGIVGSTTYTTIKNCSNSGDIIGYKSGVLMGGIAGSCKNSTIKSCYNSGTIYGESFIGGLVGESYSTTDIIACYNVGNVYSEKTTGTVLSHPYGLGGLIGAAGSVSGSGSKTTTTSCYSAGGVHCYTSTASSVGGFVGYAESATMSYCYYDSGNIDNTEDDYSPDDYTTTPGSFTGSTSNNTDTTDPYMNTLTEYGSKTTDEMQNDILSSLQTGAEGCWKADYTGEQSINNGYPILEWQ